MGGMTYRIPDDDAVSDAILVVMHRNPQVGSQAEMVKLIKAELSKHGEDYRISGERIRRVSVNRKMAELTIEYNDAGDSELPDICPVCRNPMSAVMNRTLDGGTIEVMRKCGACPFSVGKQKRMPGRYIFNRKSR